MVVVPQSINSSKTIVAEQCLRRLQSDFDAGFGRRSGKEEILKMSNFLKNFFLLSEQLSAFSNNELTDVDCNDWTDANPSGYNTSVDCGFSFSKVCWIVLYFSLQGSIWLTYIGRIWLLQWYTRCLQTESTNLENTIFFKQVEFAHEILVQ